jgi:hypothetical protein
MDTRLFGFSTKGYREHFLDRGGMFARVIEKELFSVVNGSRAAHVHRRFRVQPRFRGVCAGSGKDYASVEYRAKEAVRGLTRRVAPFVWI